MPKYETNSNGKYANDRNAHRRSFDHSGFEFPNLFRISDFDIRILKSACDLPSVAIASSCLLNQYIRMFGPHAVVALLVQFDRQLRPAGLHDPAAEHHVGEVAVDCIPIIVRGA